MMIQDGAAMEPTSEEKIAFVQALPADMGPNDIVKKAAEAGITISRSYVGFARRKTAAKVELRPQGGMNGPGAKPRKWKGTKRDFILERPNMTAGEVVAAASAQGITLNPHSVHSVRSAAKAAAAKGRKIGKRTTKTVVKKHGKNAESALVPHHPANGAPTSLVRTHASAPRAAIPARSEGAIANGGAHDPYARVRHRKDAEAMFSRLVSELGLIRVEELVAELRRRFAEPVLLPGDIPTV